MDEQVLESDTLEGEELPFDKGWDQDPTDPKNTPIKEWVEPVKVNPRQVMTMKSLQRGAILVCGYPDIDSHFTTVVTDPPSASWWNGIWEFTTIDPKAPYYRFTINLKTRPILDQGVRGFKTEKGKNPKTVMFGHKAVFFRTGRKRLTEEQVEMLERQSEKEEREAEILGRSRP